MGYEADPERYQKMTYRRCGRSGVRLSAVSLGLWQNFGWAAKHDVARGMVLDAFDAGVVGFDLANNYGPPPGSAEETFGRILRQDLAAYRDELFIATKAGYGMWDGPFGEWGSRKYLVASLDQSLKRMGLDYVDVFYSHRPDPETPIEETMDALASVVRQGKALYVGLSNYSADQTRAAIAALGRSGVHCLLHQPKYSMLDRWIEGGLLDVLDQNGIGAVAFSPLAQGALTDRYLQGVPAGSRAAGERSSFDPSRIAPEMLDRIRALDALAKERGQTLAQMALAWVLRHDAICSVIIGASSRAQVAENLRCLDRLAFTRDELDRIDRILA